jgi:hypothetical protein
MVPAAIAVVVLLLLVAGGLYLKSRPPSAGSSTAHASPSPKTSPRVSPTPTNTGAPLAVPVYAAAKNSPVASVVFLPDATCKLSGGCRVDVEMTYTKSQSGPLGYVLKFFDRCTGTTTDLPGRSFTPPTSGPNKGPYIRGDPGFETVSLPPGAKSAGLVAVSTTPAAAASKPMLLGSGTC